MTEQTTEDRLRQQLRTLEEEMANLVQKNVELSRTLEFLKHQFKILRRQFAAKLEAKKEA